ATSGTRLAMVKESGPMRLNRIWGESVTFSPVVPTGTWVTNIVWNAKTIIAIVVPGKQASLTVIDQSYTERLRVSDGSHSLEITHLSQEDTGTYTAQITIQGMTKPILQRFALHMYSKSRMEISDSVLTVNGMCNVTLHCTLQGGGEDVSYTWNQIAESTVVSSEGSIFISHRLRSGVSPVTCTARNPVSSSSKSISLQEFCEGDILQQQVLLAIILAVCVISDGTTADQKLSTRRRFREELQQEFEVWETRIYKVRLQKLNLFSLREGWQVIGSKLTSLSDF
uniref:Ig-like domain-containing protein n=1 Tax=Chelonoidis abingdonii TaxID=106734 RepID=A0A8C0IXS1_CHEAB